MVILKFNLLQSTLSATRQYDFRFGTQPKDPKVLSSQLHSLPDLWQESTSGTLRASVNRYLHLSYGMIDSRCYGRLPAYLHAYIVSWLSTLQSNQPKPSRGSLGT